MSKYTLRLGADSGIVGTADTIHGIVGLASALPDYIRETCDVYVMDVSGRRMSVKDAADEADVDQDADTIQTPEAAMALIIGSAA